MVWCWVVADSAHLDGKCSVRSACFANGRPLNTISRRRMLVIWLGRVGTYDGILPVLVWLAPWCVAFAFPGRRGVIEVLAILLPVVGFLVRYGIGRHLISRNACGDGMRRLQFVMLCLGLGLLAFIDCVIVLLNVMPKGALRQPGDWMVFTGLASLYLGCMGFAMFPGWNRQKKWFGKNSKSQPETEAADLPERRSELRDAWVAFDNLDFDGAIKTVGRFLRVGDDNLAREARKVVALSEFRKRNFTEAMVLFQGLAAASADASDWFNVITAAAMAGEIPTAEHALQVAIQCQEAANYSQQPSIPFMRYYFACALRDRREYGTAFGQLEELRALYEQLRITDDTYLHLRGMPFLSQTMSLAVEVLRGLGDSIEPEVWLQDFGGRLDEDGENDLKGIASAFSADD